MRFDIVNQSGDRIVEATDIIDLSDLMLQADQLGGCVVVKVGATPAILPFAARDLAEAMEKINMLNTHLAEYKNQLGKADEENTFHAGLLADLADILFVDENRALYHGYDGLIERAKLASAALRKNS